MAIIISVFNQKGGVGKSTTVINLAAILSKNENENENEYGKRVLIVDMDPQSNASAGVGINDDELTENEIIYSLMKTKKNTESYIKETIYPNLYIIPSDITLSDGEIELSNAISRETILKRVLEPVRDQFDYIVIDCPPSLGLLNVNALVSSDLLIVPVTTSFFSIKGIKHLLKTYDLIRSTLNPKLEIMGILITKYSKKKKLAKTIRQSLIDAFGDKVFKTEMREDAQVETSQDEQIPLVYFNRTCRAYEDYENLRKEVLAWEAV